MLDVHWCEVRLLLCSFPDSTFWTSFNCDQQSLGNVLLVMLCIYTYLLFFFIFHFQKQQWKVFIFFFWSFQVRMTSTFRYNSDNNLNWWWNLHFNVCISGFPSTALSSSSNNEMIWIPLICNEYNLCVAQYQTRL